MPRFSRRNLLLWSAAAIGSIACALAVVMLVTSDATDCKTRPAVTDVTSVGDESMPADPASTPGSAAMRIAIDPETGDLIPITADPDAKATLDPELAAMLSRSSDGLHEEILPDGSVMVDLQGRFMNASLAKIDENGELKTTCTHSATDAAHLLSCPEHTEAAQPTADQESSRTAEVQ